MKKVVSNMFDFASREHALPIMKGEKKMSNEKKAENGSWPVFPMPKWDIPDWNWGDWDGNKEKAKEKFDSFKADMKSFWEKGIDLQKSSIDKSKEQYDQFFANFQEMMDDFADSLPEELPLMPPCFDSPKAFRKAMKEWEEMVNDYFKEQADLRADFAIKGQEKACEQIPEAEKKAEDAEVVEVAAEVEDAAEEPKEAKPARQTKAAK